MHPFCREMDCFACARNDVEGSVPKHLTTSTWRPCPRSPRGQEFLHHLRWRDVYHFHRAPVYQHFSCDRQKAGDCLRV